jgi:hypothetical protein
MNDVTDDLLEEKPKRVQISLDPALFEQAREKAGELNMTTDQYLDWCLTFQFERIPKLRARIAAMQVSASAVELGFKKGELSND